MRCPPASTPRRSRATRDAFEGGKRTTTRATTATGAASERGSRARTRSDEESRACTCEEGEWRDDRHPVAQAGERDENRKGARRDPQERKRGAARRRPHERGRGGEREKESEAGEHSKNPRLRREEREREVVARLFGLREPDELREDDASEAGRILLHARQGLPREVRLLALGRHARARRRRGDAVPGAVRARVLDAAGRGVVAEPEIDGPVRAHEDEATRGPRSQEDRGTEDEGRAEDEREGRRHAARPAFEEEDRREGGEDEEERRRARGARDAEEKAGDCGSGWSLPRREEEERPRENEPHEAFLPEADVHERGGAGNREEEASRDPRAPREDGLARLRGEDACQARERGLRDARGADRAEDLQKQSEKERI